MGAIAYYLGTSGARNSKSVCLFRRDRQVGVTKIARFQSDEAARLFAAEMDWPLSDDHKARLVAE